jgi:hypothetical protein
MDYNVNRRGSIHNNLHIQLQYAYTLLQRAGYLRTGIREKTE